MKDLNRKILIIKRNNMTEYIPMLLDLFKYISQEKNISIQFQVYLQKLSLFYKN